MGLVPGGMVLLVKGTQRSDSIGKGYSEVGSHSKGSPEVGSQWEGSLSVRP